jgi:bifunctional non-homologous end joining protein LigD
LACLPDDTVIDDEVVVLDDSGRPSFNALQNAGSAEVPIFYYVFDVLVLAGRDVMTEPLHVRCKLLAEQVLTKLKDPVRECPHLEASFCDVTAAVREQVSRGVVAKNVNSTYESGRLSGSWQKMRINKGQEFRHRRLHHGWKLL